MTEAFFGKAADNAALREGIRFFTRETQILTALTAVCGMADRLEAAADGVPERAVFDLASVTKLFTVLCALRLREEGRLDPALPVTRYDPRFRRLDGVSVMDLLAFRVSLQTPERIDGFTGRGEGLACLLETASAGAPGRRAYSDIPAMILKYVVEGAAGMPLYECVRRTVLMPAGMEETWAAVPPERLGDCLRYGPEYRIERDVRRVRPAPPPGVPHDPKAALLQGASGDLCGHAGLFSTPADLVRFCRALLGGRIVSTDTLKEMAVNRTGRPWPGGGYSQYLGLQCYVRHPDQYYSEIPAYMGSAAFGIGGFTGNHLSVDPVRGLFVIFLGNRVRDRLTVLVPPEGKTLTDYGLRADGVGTVAWPDGRQVRSSVQYVHQKDAHLHSAVARALGLEPVPFGAV